MNAIHRASEPPFVLHVEDDDAVAYLMHTAFRQQNAAVEIKRLCDGAEALNFLERYNRSQRHLDLVLLDLNLPKKDVRAVLAAIRNNCALSDLAVVILSSSAEPRDREYACGLGVAGYIVKPRDFVCASRKFVPVGSTSSPDC